MKTLSHGPVTLQVRRSKEIEDGELLLPDQKINLLHPSLT